MALHRFPSLALKSRIDAGSSPSPAHPPAPTPARVHHALTTRLALDVLHGDGLDAGSAVAAKAGADAPGGGISLCFCRRGCAAPANRPPCSTDSLANDNSRHAQRPSPQHPPKKPPRSTALAAAPAQEAATPSAHPSHTPSQKKG